MSLVPRLTRISLLCDMLTRALSALPLLWLCLPGRDDFGLNNINIGIDMGSRIAIAGPNGAGKTTLMNLLSGGSELSCSSDVSAMCVAAFGCTSQLKACLLADAALLTFSSHLTP